MLISVISLIIAAATLAKCIIEVIDKTKKK